MTDNPNGRTWVWPLLILGVAGLVFGLARSFPGAVQGPEGWSRVVYQVLLVTLVCAGVGRLSRTNLRRHLRDIAIWLAIAGVLVLGYAYRDVFSDARERVSLALSGGRPVVTAERELVVPRDESGHFLVFGKIDGQPVRFLVDTGASDTVLSPDDARRLGIDVDSLDYGYASETANGVGYGASQIVGSLEVGPIRRENFRVMVNKAPMSASLLGMSFLGDLESYQVRGDRLTLTWRTAQTP